MRVLVVLMLVAVAACGPRDGAVQRDVIARQAPSVTTPGIQISGDARFGVKRGF